MNVICETLDLIWRLQKLAAIQFDIDSLDSVESRCGAVALGLACLFPSLSFDGALVTLP